MPVLDELVFQAPIICLVSAQVTADKQVGENTRTWAGRVLNIRNWFLSDIIPKPAPTKLSGFFTPTCLTGNCLTQ